MEGGSGLYHLHMEDFKNANICYKITGYRLNLYYCFWTLFKISTSST